MDRQHKLVYCYLPKVGSTTFKTLLRDASSAPRAREANAHSYQEMAKFAGLPKMNTLPLNETLAIINSPEYLKFIIVRHPFDRLLSVYRDKFIGNETEFTAGIAVGIFQEMRGWNETHAVQVAQGTERPSWEEFVTYMSRHHQISTVHTKNRHWTRQVELCYPCTVKYDRILKLETIDNDFAPILARLTQSLARNKISTFRRLNNSARKGMTRDAFKNLP